MSGPGTETPNAAPPGQPAPPSGSGSASQATAAVGNAVATLRQRLVAGEQLVLTAASVIVLVVYLVWEFLLDYRVVSDFTVVLAVLTILAIWIHRWGHYDFGKGYRVAHRCPGSLAGALRRHQPAGLGAWRGRLRRLPAPGRAHHLLGQRPRRRLRRLDGLPHPGGLIGPSSRRCGGAFQHRDRVTHGWPGLRFCGQPPSPLLVLDCTTRAAC